MKVQPIPFVAPGIDRSVRRVLLVAPAFPPSLEVGALRWQNIALLSASRGWGFDVITGGEPEEQSLDEHRLSALPPGTRVWHLPIPITTTLKLHRGAGRLLRAVRRPVKESQSLVSAPTVAVTGSNERVSLTRRAIRTARAFSYFEMWDAWGDDALDVAKRIIGAAEHSVIASSGPPHTAHLAARRIAAHAGKPLLIDLRDPWSLYRQQPIDMVSAYFRNRYAKDEASTCAASSLVVTNTAACAEMMRDRYPALASRIMPVMNGSDPDVRSFAGFNDTTFDIVHTGLVYFGRDPRNLFKGVRLFLDTVPEARAVAKVRFAGGQTYAGIPLDDIAAECGIAEWFSCSPRIPRSEALKICGCAAVNVLLPQDEPLAIPSKVFEYVQFPAWMLAIAKPDDAVAQLLQDTVSRAVAPDDVQGIATFLSDKYREWVRGVRPEPMNADGRFDRSRQVDLLLDAMDLIV